MAWPGRFLGFTYCQTTNELIQLTHGKQCMDITYALST